MSDDATTDIPRRRQPPNQPPLAYSQSAPPTAYETYPTVPTQPPPPSWADQPPAQAVTGDEIGKLIGGLVVVGALVCGIAWLATFVTNQMADTADKLTETITRDVEHQPWQPISAATSAGWAFVMVVALAALMVAMIHFVPRPMAFYTAAALLGTLICLTRLPSAPAVIIGVCVAAAAIFGVRLLGNAYRSTIQAAR